MEFNRCTIVRLSLGQDEENNDVGEEDRGEEDMNKDWTEGMLHGRDVKDKMARQALGKPGVFSSSKRGGEKQERCKKKRKYNLGGEDWGIGGEEETGVNTFLYSGVEGVKRVDKEIMKTKKISKGCSPT